MNKHCGPQGGSLCIVTSDQIEKVNNATRLCWALRNHWHIICRSPLHDRLQLPTAASAVPSKPKGKHLCNAPSKANTLEKKTWTLSIFLVWVPQEHNLGRKGGAKYKTHCLQMNTEPTTLLLTTSTASLYRLSVQWWENHPPNPEVPFNEQPHPTSFSFESPPKFYIYISSLYTPVFTYIPLASFINQNHEASGPRWKAECTRTNSGGKLRQATNDCPGLRP